MKDFIAVAFALTVASTSGVSRSDVMSAMKTANNDPEALATNLFGTNKPNYSLSEIKTPAPACFGNPAEKSGASGAFLR